MCVNDCFDPSRLEIEEQEAQEALDAFFMKHFGTSDVMYHTESSVR